MSPATKNMIEMRKMINSMPMHMLGIMDLVNESGGYSNKEVATPRPQPPILSPVSALPGYGAPQAPILSVPSLPTYGNSGFAALANFRMSGLMNPV
jgi:hypothetical protein